MLKSTLYRPVWLPAAITAAFLLVALALLTGTAWRSLERLGPVHRHLIQLSRLQETGLRIQELLVAHLDHDAPIDPVELRRLQDEVGEILALNSHLNAETPQFLRQIQNTLGELAENPKDALIATLDQLHKVLALEIKAHGKLLGAVYRAGELELEIAAAIMVVLPLLAILTLFLVRRRFILPLRDLGQLMVLLAGQDYSRASTDGADPILRPLLENYNHLVGRLAALEKDHDAHRKSLESQVRTAAGALLEQQRHLADAQRLAAVGELAARVAHELRNPLAGIQMALTNLRRETHEPEHAERLGLVINELTRVNVLLNGLLEQSRHQPEPMTLVPVAEAVGDLLALAAYQMPERIRLERDIPPDLSCRLPRDALHQALLNLILNARDAIADGEGAIHVGARTEDGELRLEVCDDGPGFPADLLEDGIRPFSTGRKDGTGLGLAMVQRFARDAGGEVGLRNLTPRGACVTLKLPCGNNDGRHPAHS